MLLAPYPNSPNPVDSFNVTIDFYLKGDGLVWYARPQLFFNCTLCTLWARLQCFPQGGVPHVLQHV